MNAPRIELAADAGGVDAGAPPPPGGAHTPKPDPRAPRLLGDVAAREVAEDPFVALASVAVARIDKCRKCRVEVTGRDICDDCRYGTVRADEDDQRRAEFLKALPLDIQPTVFGSHALNVRIPAAVLEEVTRRARALSHASHVVLLGPSGVGKTPLVGAMLHERFATTREIPLFVPSYELSGGKQELNERLLAPLLTVLDNAGTERDLPSNLVAEFVEARSLSARPLWVTTIHPPEMLAARYSYIVARKVFQRAEVIDFYDLLGIEHPKPAKAKGDR